MDQPILPFSRQYKKYYQEKLEPLLQNQKTKHYSTVIFFLLVLSVFGWYAIRPTIQTIFYLQREIKDKTDVNKRMDEKINALITASALYDTNVQLFPLIDEAVPQKSEAVKLADQIKNITATTNASISGMQISSVPISSSSGSITSQNTQKSQEVPVSLTVRGSYETLVALTQKLVDARRIIAITSLQFTPEQTKTKNASASGALSIKLQIKASGYYIP